ncbi:TOBE domain protein [Rippkaea orientalis PCC 8801]|uniref:TOBE domain protein n=1 Tax=Rippkaea orientalis (strain PCC 8801 / RF-1) TaxID=41431 RepID=B7K047_RIPO1|nr:molybdopterin-binding protein [Rippkaea orientalis]ACK66194.1 TOBE domain protein [Rippkaea orientalis PCC 8801]
MPKKQQGWITFQSSITERQILEQYCEVVQRTKTDVLRELLRNLAQMLSFDPTTGHPALLDVKNLPIYQLEHRIMQSSARNVLKGTVKTVTMGAVNAEITIEVAPGVEVVSIITKTSAENMGLAEGKEAYAMIKSSDVMIGVD